MKRFLLAALVVFSACETNPLAPEVEAYPVLIQGESCVDLTAGQSIPVGQVCATIEEGNLKVTYQVVPDWKISETHLWVGTSLASLPVNRSGNPQIGLFPYKSGPLAGVTSTVHYVPLSLFGLTGDEEVCDPVDLLAVAHAAVYRVLPDGSVQGETAYGQGPRLVNKGSWAMFFGWKLTCEEGQDPEPLVCETAFAKGESSACFLEEPYGFSRWGWTNGPLGPGSYSMEIFAGAGRCDTGKGELVGHLHVEYDGQIAQVVYQALPGIIFQETHLYVGNDPLARDVRGEYTVAPGQYPFIHDLENVSRDEFVVENLDGEIYIVAHSVACELPRVILSHE